MSNKTTNVHYKVNYLLFLNIDYVKNRSCLHVVMLQKFP